MKASDLPDIDDEELATTLRELREAFETTQGHFKGMMDRYQDMRLELETVKRVMYDYGTDLSMLRKRVDELKGPVRPTCPHCGRAVQKNATHCAICTKAIK